MQEERLTALEDEVKVLNNEIKQVLLDIREQVIARFQNPLPDFDIGPLEKDAMKSRSGSVLPLNPAEDDTEPEPILKPWKPEPAQASGAASGPGPAAMQGLSVAPNSGTSIMGGPASGPSAGPVTQPSCGPSSPETPTTAVEDELFGNSSPFSAQQRSYAEPEGSEPEIMTDILEPRRNGHNGSRPAKGNVSGSLREDVAGERPDLLTVATLSRWLTNGMKQVGRERMEAIIDIYEAMGGLSPELKEILLRLLKLHDGEGAPLSKTMAVLLELDNLQTRGRVDKTEAAVLSLFLNGNGNGHSRKEACHR